MFNIVSFIILTILFQYYKYNNVSTILIKFDDSNTIRIIPEKTYITDGGWDVVCISNTTIVPGINNIQLGYSLYIPKGTFLEYRARSSYLIDGLFIPSGIYDYGYSGLHSIIIYNLSNKNKTININDRIAQFVLHPYVNLLNFRIVDELPSSERSLNRFGSSGS